MKGEGGKRGWQIFRKVKALAFGVFVNGCEDGDELAGFVEQTGHLGWRNATAVHEQFKPILGFVDFFEAVANFGNELGFGAAARRRAARIRMPRSAG